jgi:hypothetical protein
MKVGIKKLFPDILYAYLMEFNVKNYQFNPNENQRNTEKGKPKPYKKPVLQILGDLRSLTLGGSPRPRGDTGDYANQRPFGFSSVHFPLVPDNNFTKSTTNPVSTPPGSLPNP